MLNSGQRITTSSTSSAVNQARQEKQQRYQKQQATNHATRQSGDIEHLLPLHVIHCKQTGSASILANSISNSVADKISQLEAFKGKAPLTRGISRGRHQKQRQGLRNSHIHPIVCGLRLRVGNVNIDTTQTSLGSKSASSSTSSSSGKQISTVRKLSNSQMRLTLANTVIAQPGHNLLTMIHHHIHKYTATAALLFVLLSFSITCIQPGAAQTNSVYDYIKKIAPEVYIPELTRDLATVEILQHNVPIRPGVSVAARDLKDLDMRKVGLKNWDASDMFAFLLYDLNRTSGNDNSTVRPYNLYASFNIPPPTMDGGNTVASYDPPIVPCSPGAKHRILALAFRQQNQFIDLIETVKYYAQPRDSKRRQEHSIKDVMAHLNLKPVAANIFFALGEQGGVCSSAQASYGSVQQFAIIMLSFMLATMMSAGLLNQTNMHRHTL